MERKAQKWKTTKVTKQAWGLSGEVTQTHAVTLGPLLFDLNLFPSTSSQPLKAHEDNVVKPPVSLSHQLALEQQHKPPRPCRACLCAGAVWRPHTAPGLKGRFLRKIVNGLY